MTPKQKGVKLQMPLNRPSSIIFIKREKKVLITPHLLVKQTDPSPISAHKTHPHLILIN